MDPAADAAPPFKVVIPARLGSTRLPRKVLADLGGRPLVAWTWDAARASGAQEVVIATDSAEVEAACRGFGADVEMTSPDLASGTDRVHAVAVARGWAADTRIVNVQGDEPRLPAALPRRCAALLGEGADAADIATLCHPLGDAAEWRDPNVVKVALDDAGRALYFSRAPIPWLRDGSGPPPGQAFRHIGLYAYRCAALARFAALPPSALERAEALEQLRALSAGMAIRVGVVEAAPPRGVDTAEDLAAVRAALAAR